MIEEKTVLIIGAGASKPYGYPTGIELIKLIGDNCLDVIENLKYYQEGPTKKILSLYAYDLQDIIKNNSNPDDQIDWILTRFEKVKPYLYDIGRMLIINFILTAENKNFDAESDNLICQPRENWYQELFSLMTKPIDFDPNPDLFKQNKVKFLTFNYDRSLDYFLKTKIERFYKNIGYNPNTGLIYSDFKPIHIYGVISDLLNDNSFGFYENKVKYLDAHKSDIELIRSNTGSRIKNEIKSYISKANKIYFLGFGYDNRNLHQLGFPGIINEKHKIYGTAHNKSDTQIKNIKNKILGDKPVSIFNVINCSCLELLQEFPPD